MDPVPGQAGPGGGAPVPSAPAAGSPDACAAPATLPSVASLDDVLEMARAVLWEADPVDWRELLVSGDVRGITGYEATEWIRVREFWEDRIHPEDRAGVLHIVDEALAATGESEPYEYRWRVADGTWRWFRDRVRMLRTPDGRERMCGVMIDITGEVEMREAGRRAARERDRLAAAMEQSTELVVMTDARGSITSVNVAFERALGYRRDEVLGRTLVELAELGARGQAERMAPAVAAVEDVAAGRAWTGEIVIPTASGGLVRLMSSVVPVRDEGGEVIATMGLHRDITHLRELETQLAQAAKLEAIGQLAGGVAHDFNNILTAILGYVSFIGDALPPESPILEDLREIAAAGERAQRLTGQLLAFGRRNVLRPEVVEVGRLLTELLPMLGRLIGEDIDLRLEVAESSSIAFVDPGQLGQSVVNLVVNARNAMPAGGTITVGAAVRQGDGERVPEGQWVVVRVTDSGIGIAPNVLGRIFEPFYTTDEFGRGTGLGLAVVDGFVRQSAGHALVSTEPGLGSTFELWLPVHVARETPAQPPVAGTTRGRPAAAGESRVLTVLVAEDEAIVRAIVRRGLRLAGHRVLLASSGQEALEVSERFDGPIDVLLADVVMPGIRGPQLAETLRRMRPGIRVVLASGYTDDEVSRRGIQLGAEAFLAKPYSMEMLLAAVEGRTPRQA